MTLSKLTFTALAALAALAFPLQAQKQPAAKPVAATEAILATTASLSLKYGDFAEAIANYENLLKRYPAAALAKEYTYQLAMAYERTGNSQKAAELFQDVVTKFKGRTAATANIDSMAMEGVGRCFNKNFQEYEVFINGRPVTKLEMDAELEKVPAMYRGQFEGAEGRQKFVERYIERTLLYDEARKLNPELDPEFYQKLQDTKQDQYIRYLIDKEVSARAHPSEAEIKAHYKKNLNDHRTKEQVKARQITVKSRAEAEQLLKDLKKAPFDSLARSRSIDSYARSGGDLGLVNRNQFPALDTALFVKTKKGQLSKIIPLDPRYAIVKLEAKDKDKLHLRWIVAGSAAEASRISAALAADHTAFDSLASSVSIDPATKEKAGDLGFVSKKDIDENVFKAAAKLRKPGDIAAKPVLFHAKHAVVKVEDKIPAGIKTLDQVKGQISSQLFSDRQRKNYEDLLTRIKGAAAIEYPKPEAAPAVPSDPEHTPTDKK